MVVGVVEGIDERTTGPEIAVGQQKAERTPTMKTKAEDECFLLVRKELRPYGEVTSKNADEVWRRIGQTSSARSVSLLEKPGAQFL